MATSTTLTLKRGDTWRTTFQWLQPDGTPVDLTGCTARMMLRDKITLAVALDISTTSGELTIDPLVGAVGLQVGALAMQVIVPGYYLTDLELTFTDGTVMSTDTTKVKVLMDVTHD